MNESVELRSGDYNRICGRSTKERKSASVGCYHIAQDSSTYWVAVTTTVPTSIAVVRRDIFPLTGLERPTTSLVWVRASIQHRILVDTDGLACSKYRSRNGRGSGSGGSYSTGSKLATAGTVSSLAKVARRQHRLEPSAAGLSLSAPRETPPARSSHSKHSSSRRRMKQRPSSSSLMASSDVADHKWLARLGRLSIGRLYGIGRQRRRLRVPVCLLQRGRPPAPPYRRPLYHLAQARDAAQLLTPAPHSARVRSTRRDARGPQACALCRQTIGSVLVQNTLAI